MLYCTYFASMLIIQRLQIVCPKKVCGGGGKSIVLLPASCAHVETFVIIFIQIAYYTHMGQAITIQC